MSRPDAADAPIDADPPASTELTRSLSSLLDAANDETLERLLANPVATAAVFLRLADQRRRGGTGVATPRRGEPPRPPLSPEQAERWLDERTVRRVRTVDTIGSAEVARLLGLGSRQAVHARLGSGHLVGFEGPKRGTRFPTAQFLDDGRVVDGLGELTTLVGHGWTLWCWLDEPLDLLDGDRPISRLREGDVRTVLAVARAEAQGDFH